MPGQGQIITGYEVLEQIAQGGMSRVYRARQLSLDRIVALKILPPHTISDSNDIERFKQEARAAAKLNHPGIVHVYDAGEQDGTYFFAMEYVKGCTVEELVKKQGKLPEKEALKIAQSVADALQYAWEKAQIVHRDIKPENLLVDEDGVVKVSDLGLLKMAGVERGLTIQGEIMGTPNYCSPEQAEGDPNLDSRSDIYSLGATLYRIVTGQIPFGDAEGTGPMVKHITDQLCDPRDINRELSAGIVMLMRKMMAKNRDHRYADWPAVLGDLRLIEKGRKPAKPLDAKIKSTIKPMTAIAGGQSGAGFKTTQILGVPRTTSNVSPQVQRTKTPTATAGKRRNLTVPVTIAVLAVIIGIIVIIAVSSRNSAQESRVVGSQRNIDRLGFVFREAQQYAETHPNDYDKAIAKFQEIEQDDSGGKYRSAVENEIGKLQARKKDAVQKALEDLGSKARNLVTNREFAAAIALCRDYNGSFAGETKDERQIMIRKIESAREKAESRKRDLEQERAAREEQEEEKARNEEKTPGKATQEKPSLRKMPDKFIALEEQYKLAEKKINDEFETARQKILETYVKGLSDLEEAVKKKGELEQVLAIRAEKDRVEKEHKLLDQMPENAAADMRALCAKMSALFQQYETARAKQAANCDRIFAEQMSALVKSLTAENHVEDALLIANRRKEFIAEKGSEMLDNFATNVLKSSDIGTTSKSQKRIKITFAGYNKNSTLANFPALVILSPGIARFSYNGFLSSSGADLRFTDSSGKELNYEIEKWDTKGKSYIWVQVPKLSASDTCIWGSWGNAGQTTQPAYTANGAVWADGFKSVWHFGQTDNALDLRDSTSNRYNAMNGSGHNAGTTVNGKISSGIHFTRASVQYADIATSDKYLPAVNTAFSVSYWALADTISNGTTANRAFGLAQNAEPASSAFATGYGATNRVFYWTCDNHGVSSTVLSSGTITPDTWNLVTVTFDGRGNWLLYVNGSVQGESKGGLIEGYPSKGAIGNAVSPSSSSGFDGSIDEVRFSSHVFSSNWVWATWMNMAMNSTFAVYQMQ